MCTREAQKLIEKHQLACSEKIYEKINTTMLDRVMGPIEEMRKEIKGNTEKVDKMFDVFTGARFMRNTILGICGMLAAVSGAYYAVKSVFFNK